MGDLISRAALLNDLSYCAPELWKDEGYIKAKIMKQPAVDVPLRCKGCSFFAPHKHDRGEDSRCTMLNMEVRENDYCSFGAWTSCEGGQHDTD